MKIFRLSQTNNIDEEYFEAVRMNNLSRLQEMVKNAAITAGFTVGPVYHGTSNIFNEFKTDFGNAIWFSENKNKIENGESGASGVSNIIPVYLKAEKTAGWDEYDKMEEERLMQSFDTVKLDDDWIVFDPKRIKSAQLITKINGRIVPLSERFGERTSDIRIAGKTQNENIGRCYELSAKYVIDHISSGATLVHARLTNPFGKGLKELDHAFVEIGNEIFDPVMNQKWPKEVYCDLFKVRETSRYTFDEIMSNIDQYHHWGPW